MKNSLKQAGFTLIELLVVIAIIGILSAVVLVSLNSARQKSRDAKRLADVRQLMTALELFYNDNGGYPAATAGAVAGTMGTIPWSTYFAGTWPTAPTPVDGTCTAANNAYTYTGTGTSTGAGNAQTYASYTLTFCIGAQTGGYPAGPKTASPSGIQ